MRFVRLTQNLQGRDFDTGAIPRLPLMAQSDAQKVKLRVENKVTRFQDARY